MKLIDIDAFYKFCDQSCKCGHEVYPEYYDDYLATDMFTVKAIPKGWISEYSRRAISNADYWAIIRMVTAWEKENEENV